MNPRRVYMVVTYGKHQDKYGNWLSDGCGQTIAVYGSPADAHARALKEECCSVEPIEFFDVTCAPFQAGRGWI